MPLGAVEARTVNRCFSFCRVDHLADAQHRSSPRDAQQVGDVIFCCTLCNLIYNQLGEPGVRRVLGVLSLAKKFGLAAVEDACAAALEMGVHEYRFVRRYLERGPQLTLRQVDPLIRELVQYRDLINHRTQEPHDSTR